MKSQYRPDDKLTARQVAEYLNVSIEWVRWQTQPSKRPKDSRFPLPIKYGASKNSPVRWVFRDIEQWLAKEKTGGKKTDPGVQAAYRELKKVSGISDDVVMLKTIMSIVGDNWTALDRLATRYNSQGGKPWSHARVLAEILEEHEKWMDIQRGMDPDNAP